MPTDSNSKRKNKSDKRSKSRSSQNYKKIRKFADKRIFGISFEELFNILGYIILAAIILSYEWLTPFETFTKFPSTLIAVAIAIIVQIIPQKYIAKKLGIRAEYQLWIPGLIFSVLMMLVGIKLIIIGAMLITPFRFSKNLHWQF